MFLDYIIVITLIFCIITFEFKNEGWKFHLTLLITLMLIIYTMGSFIYMYVKKMYRGSEETPQEKDYIFEEKIVPTLACNTTNINNYTLLLDHLGGVDTIITFKALGECNLIIDYIQRNDLIYIINSAGIKDVYMLTQEDDRGGIFNVVDLTTGSKISKMNVDSCKMGGVCNNREKHSFMFKSAQDGTFFYDFEDYDDMVDDIVYYRSINIKLSNLQCITKVYILNSKSVNVKECQNVTTEDYDIGNTPECINSIITTPDLISRKIHIDLIYYGSNMLSCNGIIYMMEQIIRSQGVCRAIKILNSQIDRFGFGLGEYLPFVYRYNKLDGGVYTEVNYNTEYLGLTIQDISNNIKNLAVQGIENVEKKETMLKNLTYLMRSDLISIFIDCIDGKNVDEIVSIQPIKQKPVILRTLNKIYNVDSKPYDFYFFGCGYTVSYISSSLF